MCVLINIASASEKARDSILDRGELLSAIANILRSSEKVDVLIATCTVVKHIVDSGISGLLNWIDRFARTVQTCISNWNSP